MRLFQCPDGYMTCRQAEAGGLWCEDRCACGPRSDAEMLREAAGLLEALIKARPAIEAFWGPSQSLGNFSKALNNHIKGLK